MLNTPFFVGIWDIWTFADDLSVDIAAHFDQVSDEFDELVFVLDKFVEGGFLGLGLVVFVFVHFFIDDFLEIWFGGFYKILDKIQKEVETVDVNLFEVNSELVCAGTLEFFLDKDNLFISFTGDVAQTV